MKSRYLVLGLSLVLALALAVPALGGPTNPLASISATVKQTANKALKKAKAAQQTANSALATANTANNTADTASKAATSASNAAKAAQTTANTAQTAAKNAQTTADTAKTAAATAQTAANNAQATANSKFGDTVTEFGETSGPNAATGSAAVSCPGSSQVTGGGFITSGTGNNEIVPTLDTSYGDAWLVAMDRIPGGANTWSVQAVVVCAQP